jgi:hypothetical protein
VKTRFDKIGYPLYCDAGPDEGSMRVDMQVRLYLSAEEYARYEGAEDLRVTLKEDEAARLPGAGPDELRVLRSDPAKLPPSYGVDAGGMRDRLLPGVRVIRELSAVGEHECVTEVPCCGRPVTIPVPGDEASPALCCRCGVTYTAAVAEEEPDGYSDEPLKVAVFVVEHVGAAAARHRAGRWEPALGSRRPGGGQ